MKRYFIVLMMSFIGGISAEPIQLNEQSEHFKEYSLKMDATSETIKLEFEVSFEADSCNQHEIHLFAKEISASYVPGGHRSVLFLEPRLQSTRMLCHAPNKTITKLSTVELKSNINYPARNFSFGYDYILLIGKGYVGAEVLNVEVVDETAVEVTVDFK